MSVQQSIFFPTCATRSGKVESALLIAVGRSMCQVLRSEMLSSVCILRLPSTNMSAER